MKRITQLVARLLYPAVQFHRRVFRPKTFGVKCVIKSGSEILLVRHTYGKRFWTFPGGGMKKREKPEDAVKREMKEELGVELVHLKYLGELPNVGEKKQDIIHCFSADAESKELQLDRFEILEARWYPLGNLPQPLSPLVNQILSISMNL